MKISRKLMMVLACSTLLMLFMGGTCTKGKTGAAGATGPAGPPSITPTNTLLGHKDPLPGMVISITSITGASGAGGAFQVGDKPKVTFTIKKNNGQLFAINEINYLRVMLSGPTFNYQRVIGALNDVLTTSVVNTDGSYTYTFSTAIPATYMAPLNDTASYDTTDGELTGQALLSGTYTVAVYGYKTYTIDGTNYNDLADSQTKDILFGTAATIDKREVAKASNCNQCHVRLQAHGGSRNNNVTVCLMCHTSGAEDTNAGGSTPGVLVDFRSMIHKIHAGAHLPSVVGRGVTAAGAPDYTVAAAPFIIAGHDYSEIAFPAWPNLNVAMPREAGYTALAAADQTKSNTIRMGPTGCNLCHGDPDGTGSLTAPLQGGLSNSQPTRRSCGSCHDDIDWTKPYQKNGMTMPPQANDANCLTCHIPTGTATAGNPPSTADAHLHPLMDPVLNLGINFNVSAITEAGTNNGNGKIDPGEKIALSFTVKANDGSTDVVPTGSMSFVVNGPTNNQQMVLYTTIPVGALVSTPYTLNLPEPVRYERVGLAANDAAIETFTVSRFPTWDAVGAAATVYCRTASGTATTVAVATTKDINYLTVASTAGFANNDFCVIDDGTGSVEYKQVGYVDTTNNRLWFKAGSYAQQTPLKFAHAIGAAVQQVTLTAKTLTTHYTVNAATGVISEAAVASFPAGQAVVVTYTTDFVMPATYPAALNNSADNDETIGDWTGKPIVPGTYTVGIWGPRTFSYTRPGSGEATSYNGVSRSTLTNFLVGSATTLEPYNNMVAANCNRCHVEPRFHGGGRLGYDTCTLCHQTSGAEDTGKFTVPAALPTTGVSVEFRNMLHKIHAGAELYNAATYTVLGNNASVHQYSEVEFPVWRDGVKNCAVCHANNPNFHELTDRSHPTAQGAPEKAYTFSCLSCHDSPGAAAHATLMTTSGGAESCSVCHGDGAEYSVLDLHKPRP